MRTLTLSWEYPPLIEGGLARHVGKLSEALVRRGVEVHVLVRGGPGSPAPPLVAGVQVHRVPEPSWPRDLSRFIAWVAHMNEDMLAAGRELAAQHAFDLIHAHDWLVGEAARGLADELGLPLLCTVHATEHGRHQGHVDRPPQSTIHELERAMVRRADGVITCSHYMRGHVADVFGIAERRITVIPNGVDPADLQPACDLERLRGRFAAPQERLVLLIGRLVYEKGFQIALDALPQVIERVGDVRFIVAGSGPHEAELRAQATRLGLDAHGDFLGWIGDDALHSLYRIADLCVVPSLYEPFGLVALEAMASGCPCVVADTGGLREVVPSEQVGLRFRARDSDSLASMLERVLCDEILRERLVAEASEHVLRFDWDDIARRTERRYARLRRRRRGRGRPRTAGSR
ncbi:MAG TPA: glycosyltransferase family 4 protein [Solirubrobacteraceae bacterium]|nr:glycosyltransferase family 4 protein [Solirubrobacteraceae bacterium]